MKKLGGQKDLVPENIPECKDKEIAQKLEQVWKLRDGAKMHDKLVSEVKEFIQGWVLGLPKKDQSIGQFKCGDFVLTFSVEMQEEKKVEYTTKKAKKVKVRLAPEDDEKKSE